MKTGSEERLQNANSREAQLLRAPPTSTNKIVMWDELIDLLRDGSQAAPQDVLVAWYRDLKARIIDGDLQVYVKPQFAKDRTGFLKRLTQSAEDDFDALSGCLFDSDRLATHGRLFDTAHIQEMGG